MRTLVFAFDVSKLDEVGFRRFMEQLFKAQDSVHLGLCQYNTFEVHGVMDVHRKLDELRDPEGNEVPL